MYHASGDHYCGLEQLLLSVIATPIIGNSQADDPSCTWVTGSTCSLRIGVYLSGCLLDLVLLWGKGTDDRPPVIFQVTRGKG